MALSFKQVSMMPGVQTDVLGGDTIGNTDQAVYFGTSYTLPANWLRAGRGLQVQARGHFLSTGVDSLTLDLMMGTTAVCTVQSTALTNIATRQWTADFLVLGASTSGWVEGQGSAAFNITATTTRAAEGFNQAAINLGSTGTQSVALRATWSSASASDTITMRTFVVEVFGAS